MRQMQIYKINPHGIIFEVIDGEVIVLNINSGEYYNMTGTGALIFQLIVDGKAYSEVVDQILCRYVGCSERISLSVSGFIEELLEEKLIIKIPEDLNNSSAISLEAFNINAVLSAVNKSEYLEPNMNKYTEMADLLLLDPIHQVQDAGWPNKK